MSDLDLLPGKRFAPAHLGRVLVVGLGKSGMAAVRYCAGLLGGRVESLTVSAGKPNAAAEAFVESFAGSGIDFRFVYEDIQEQFDLCIVSPGIADTSALYASAKAASKELVSELEFAWRESDTAAVWVGITGTNGKTTTTSLVTHVCVSAGLKAHAVGNIGEVALTCVAENPQDVYVAEISSFQLASSSKFAPEIAILLNITPDHLYWHGSMERYIDAKRQLLAHMVEETGEKSAPTAILDCTNPIVADIANELASVAPNTHLIRITEALVDAPEAGAVACEADGRLTLQGACATDFGGVEDLQIKGEHNVINALAAGAACTALGISAQDIARGLASFAPLEHRVEPCGECGGVRYVNDSKGTNVDATCKAFTAFPAGKVICLLGGTDKGTDLAPLVAAARKTCKTVVCYGEAKDRFVTAFAEAPEVQVLQASSMAEAARLAHDVAVPGDVVLLSPACASFDEFSGYEERGRVFKALVKTEFITHGC